MQELKEATGIDQPVVPTFLTTRQEDITYLLFGIFGVRLPVDYDEKQDKALGRLLQEIVAWSSDITSLDWIGKASEFNSCLPASITSYRTPPCKLPPLPEDEIQSSISSLQKTKAVDFALNLYTLLRDTSAPRFAAQRLHLPCIAFNVRKVRRVLSPVPDTHFTYRVKADGLRDLFITTAETLIQFWPARPTEQKFVLVRPWDRSLLELPDFVEPPEFVEPSNYENNTENGEDYCMSPSPSDDSSSGFPVRQDVFDLESRALRLLVRLRQPFSAFLLAQQRSVEYKKIATDHDIIGQVNDVVSVRDLMDFKEQCSALAAHDESILGAEIPEQGQDGYDIEPNFFHGMHQRPGHLKRLELAIARKRQSAPAPIPPTTSPPVALTTTFKTHLQHLFTQLPHHATPPVIDVPFAQGKEYFLEKY
ncbi:uncharacterized protein EDB93DRAFT_1257432 [Suillus bovinus]|uniref:uncharacterized protein n=1 Tax=Suillus bovinus TaxID=48563 RepID=UPI001B86A19C|nr:uncharacterized protein EDB93DRAFT_1257432 [Suillus bovinus]KAG2126788.1 hypothetical protein EDB93DRAFT_1257432 [Suillus bovinus]